MTSRTTLVLNTRKAVMKQNTKVGLFVWIFCISCLIVATSQQAHTACNASNGTKVGLLITFVQEDWGLISSEGIMGENDNDNDGVPGVDKATAPLPPTDDDPDIKRVVLQAIPETGGTLPAGDTISLRFDSTVLHVWKDAQKTQTVNSETTTWPANTSPTIYVEGFHYGETDLRLVYDQGEEEYPGDCKIEVKITVIRLVVKDYPDWWALNTRADIPICFGILGFGTSRALTKSDFEDKRVVLMAEDETFILTGDALYYGDVIINDPETTSWTEPNASYDNEFTMLVGRDTLNNVALEIEQLITSSARFALIVSLSGVSGDVESQYKTGLRITDKRAFIVHVNDDDHNERINTVVANSQTSGTICDAFSSTYLEDDCWYEGTLYAEQRNANNPVWAETGYGYPDTPGDVLVEPHRGLDPTSRTPYYSTTMEALMGYWGDQVAFNQTTVASEHLAEFEGHASDEGWVDFLQLAIADIPGYPDFRQSRVAVGTSTKWAYMLVYHGEQLWDSRHIVDRIQLGNEVSVLAWPGTKVHTEWKRTTSATIDASVALGIWSYWSTISSIVSGYGSFLDGNYAGVALDLLPLDPAYEVFIDLFDYLVNPVFDHTGGSVSLAGEIRNQRVTADDVVYEPETWAEGTSVYSLGADGAAPVYHVAMDDETSTVLDIGSSIFVSEIEVMPRDVVRIFFATSIAAELGWRNGKEMGIAGKLDWNPKETCKDILLWCQ